jgi:uncharacterized protein (DUF1501 family)
LAITRRDFILEGSLAALGTASAPSFVQRATNVAQVDQPLSARVAESCGDKITVVVLLRGAADGLSMIVPYADTDYYSSRPTIAIPRGQVIELDSFFGLHPEMRPLYELWKCGHFAVVHATGLPYSMRSHYDAQDFVEAGGLQNFDGWLGRALHGRAIAVGSSPPRILSGKASPNCERVDASLLGFLGSPANPEEGIGAGVCSVDTFRYCSLGKSRTEASPSGKRPWFQKKNRYPLTEFAERLSVLAATLKSDSRTRVGFVDFGGWDHHENEGSTDGKIAHLIRDFSLSIDAFWKDLGDLAADTVIVTMSEFGRTLLENGARGTGHGHGNVMLIIGGSVNGGKAFGRWPGLSRHELHEGRSLAVTTDFRYVLGEIVFRHMKNSRLDLVFPRFENDRSRFLNFLR